MASINRHPGRLLGAVLALSAALRAAFFAISVPGLAPDSVGYLALARMLTRLNLAGDDGLRTPGYPLYLAALGLNLDLARAGQMLLGLLTTALLFYIAWQVTRQALLAALAAAIYGWNPSLISIENMLLTESMATLCVTLSAAAFTWLFSRVTQRAPVGWALLLAGLASALTALVRPTFMFLPVWLALLAWIVLARARVPRAPFLAALSLVPALLLLGSWTAFNCVRLNYCGPSTIMGITLADHSLRMAESIPAEYPVIRDTYLRIQHDAGTHASNFWAGGAPAEILAKTGWSLPRLSQELLRMSLQVLAQHPLEYAANVWTVWLDFWNARGLIINWEESATIRPEWQRLMARVARHWDRIEQAVTLFGVNLPFLLLAGATLLLAPWRRARAWLAWPVPVWMMAGIVLLTSLLSSALEYAENARYALPVRGLAACTLICALWWLITAWKRRAGATRPAILANAHHADIEKRA